MDGQRGVVRVVTSGDRDPPTGGGTDPIVIADRHWKRLGYDTGWHMRAALSLHRADELIRERAETALRPDSLTRARHEALAVLYFSRRGEMPLGRLGAHLLVHPTSVTSTVDALEGLGLVARVRHPTDRRTTLARVTAKGRRAMRDSCARMAADRLGLAGLDHAEAARLFDLLSQVRVEAGDLDGGNGAGIEDPIRTAEQHWAGKGWITGPWFRASVSVYRVAELIRLANDAAVGPFGLTHVRFEALAVLDFSQHGAMPMGALGRHLLVHPTSVTSTVDTLQRLGYVERAPHATDRRTTLARITPDGRAAVQSAIQALAADRCGLRALSMTRAREVFRLLAKVRLGG